MIIKTEPYFDHGTMTTVRCSRCGPRGFRYLVEPLAFQTRNVASFATVVEFEGKFYGLPKGWRRQGTKLLCEKHSSILFNDLKAERHAGNNLVTAKAEKNNSKHHKARRHNAA